MFKRIRSNRDPRDTLYSELSKEFSVYADKGTAAFRSFIGRYPRQVFGAMIMLLLASLLFAVLLHGRMLPKDATTKPLKSGKQPLDEGFERIVSAGAALKQTIHLRRKVDSLTAKKALTRGDSILLLRDLDSLQQIRITVPH
ncbi:MAG: hypothetical protein JST19_19325 [Bacteroidetes bacterium]|nr:hypothetical protein [Bacteroidota bacterium]